MKSSAIVALLIIALIECSIIGQVVAEKSRRVLVPKETPSKPPKNPEAPIKPAPLKNHTDLVCPPGGNCTSGAEGLDDDPPCVDLGSEEKLVEEKVMKQGSKSTKSADSGNTKKPKASKAPKCKSSKAPKSTKSPRSFNSTVGNSPFSDRSGSVSMKFSYAISCFGLTVLVWLTI